jgi:hypothetical protein
MPIEETMNSYEYKLKKAGLAEPITTYLADPLDVDRLKAGFPAYNIDGGGTVIGLVGPDGEAIALGGGSGSSTYAGLSDAATANLPAINTALGTALSGKATTAQGAKADTAIQPADLVSTDLPTVNTALSTALSGKASTAQGTKADTALQPTVPTAFTSRALTNADDGVSLICSTAQVATVNTGLVASFGCSFKGIITFNGTATISDLRTTGSANPWCSLVKIATDTYDVLGTKA